MRRAMPVGDVRGQAQLPEGSEEAGDALLKLLRLPRVPSSGHDRHIDARLHQ